ncbi:Chemotaxis protein CheY [Beijerinckiaceae bacterium RH AL1]|jgi:two-component system chemotaxis response regulator CheY|nr:response regulator [Beijerinckiaceae bacterium]VVB47575.1 Chemotaxis protein CheY [Beijerinckiaceae bacterium RH CH11]VVB47656.1 Chemotaxis protein CheY [Beijerinckiaceae bacterium RH AL8]VVC55959.1 Chemotaxis protein CheY [Beijerinckiaceae bacterium RH AL1]
MIPPFSRILVVDDSQVVRKLVRAMLSEAGFANVDEAEDGQQALTALNLLRYALVISDWLMEPMSGLDLLKAVRQSERHARQPFIMMTTQNQRKFAEVARDAGATQFLTKPFTARKLAEKIAAIDVAETV